jgi:hypothetical protein
MTYKIQLCRMSLLFPCFLAAQRVLSDVIARHQEHLSCSYSFWFYSRVLLSAAVMAEYAEYEFLCSRDSGRQ